MKYINIYYLNGIEYDGEIYFMSNIDDKNGFICASDPNFIYILTVIKVHVNNLKKRYYDEF